MADSNQQHNQNTTQTITKLNKLLDDQNRYTTTPIETCVRSPKTSCFAAVTAITKFCSNCIILHVVNYTIYNPCG